MNSRYLYVALLIIALVMPMWVYPIFLMKLLCFAVFASAFNLLIGYTGLLSFGHAAFFGTAGYVTGYLLKHVGASIEISIVTGALAGGILGAVIGAIAIRRQGIYFTMITMALAQMLYFVFLQAPFTGGEDGLQGVPRGQLFGFISLDHDLTLYYIVLAISIACFALIIRTVDSPFGQVLRAIKENEPRAISLGYDVNRYKLLAFVLSAALAGIAGSTKTVVMGFETLTDVHWSMSGLVVLMTLIGGLGTRFGPIVGAIIIVSLENKLGDIGIMIANASRIDWFRSLGETVSIASGLIFIVCVLSFRRGIVGQLAYAIERARVRRLASRESGAVDSLL